MDDERIVRWVEQGAALLGLPVTDANRAAVVGNLARLEQIAQRLDGLPIEPHDEPLPVFHR
jgi:hypothetical protein